MGDKPAAKAVSKASSTAASCSGVGPQDQSPGGSGSPSGPIGGPPSPGGSGSPSGPIGGPPGPKSPGEVVRHLDQLEDLLHLGKWFTIWTNWRTSFTWRKWFTIWTKRRTLFSWRKWFTIWTKRRPSSPSGNGSPSGPMDPLLLLILPHLPVDLHLIGPSSPSGGPSPSSSKPPLLIPPPLQSPLLQMLLLVLVVLVVVLEGAAVVVELGPQAVSVVVRSTPYRN